MTIRKNTESAVCTPLAHRNGRLPLRAIFATFATFTDLTLSRALESRVAAGCRVPSERGAVAVRARISSRRQPCQRTPPRKLGKVGTLGRLCRTTIDAPKNLRIKDANHHKQILMNGQETNASKSLHGIRLISACRTSLVATHPGVNAPLAQRTGRGSGGEGSRWRGTG
jgi:hypothetical protein